MGQTVGCWMRGCGVAQVWLREQAVVPCRWSGVAQRAPGVGRQNTAIGGAGKELIVSLMQDRWIGSVFVAF